MRLHRLRLLELTEARYGSSTPPETTMEIASTRRELGIADTLVASPITVAFAQEIGPANQFAVIIDLFRESREMQATRARTVDERFDRVEDELDRRTRDQDAKRRAGQRRTMIILVLFTLALLANSALVIWVALALRSRGL